MPPGSGLTVPLAPNAARQGPLHSLAHDLRYWKPALACRALMHPSVRRLHAVCGHRSPLFLPVCAACSPRAPTPTSSSAGVPLGVACVGLGRSFGGAGLRAPLALAVALPLCLLCTVLTMLCALPVGVSEPEAIAVDRGRWQPCLAACSAGALVAVGAWELWPRASVAKPEKAKAGLLLGAAVAGMAWLLQAGLCLATPYCLTADTASH